MANVQPFLLEGRGPIGVHLLSMGRARGRAHLS